MEVGVMPKELVMSGREFAMLGDGEIAVEDIKPESGAVILRRGAVVRWTRDTDLVELGVSKVATSNHEESGQHYMTLDRTAVNRLIRSLRKARDQAFGADA
jgi:hypothetical protein